MDRGLKRRAAIAGCLAALGLFVSSVPSVAAGKTVRATDDRTFSPAAVSISKGGTVTFTNPSDDRHNVTSYGTNWSMAANLEEGQKTTKRFTKKGTFKYRCTLHSSVSSSGCDGMCGKVRVTAG